MDIGAHCSVAACHQQDFLPFTCDCCDRAFCLQHRTYDAHACPSAGSRDRRVVQCPLCRQSLRWTREEDVNVVWETHVRSGQCAPSPGAVASGQLKPKKKKPRCGATRCRELLLASNQFHCPKCQLDVCLRHRFETDHDCEGTRSRQRQQRASTLQQQQQQPARRAMSVDIDTQALQRNARAAASKVANGTRSAVTSIVQKGKAAVASTTTANANAPETCPICQQTFPYVSQLIAHVNRAHPEQDPRRAPAATATATAAASTSSAREICPQCHATFADVTALITHVENAHGRTPVAASSSSSARGSDDKCNLM